MAKIYTRTGDTGETSLLGGRRVRKDDLRIEAIGSVDEVNAAIGLARVELTRSGVAPAGLDELLAQIQHRLFDLGAELAALPGAAGGAGALSDADATALETAIDSYDAELAPLRAFILPGGAPAAAQLHLARCVCRRAERRLVELARAEILRGETIRYLNRLSDLLFVLARAVNQANRVPDVTWEQGAGSREQGGRGKHTV
ncbi:MAG: cob(I)yrinic acid a,c-diamide adenosyltransferase [Pirellulales bacterium]